MMVTLLLGAMALSAQTEQLPDKIREAFDARFPGAKNMDWYLTNENYSIEFDQKGDSYTVIYSREGDWKETAIVISDLDIPSTVTGSVNKQCPGNELAYAESVENDKGNKFYRIHCFNEKADFIFDVTAAGEVLTFRKVDGDSGGSVQ